MDAEPPPSFDREAVRAAIARIPPLAGVPLEAWDIAPLAGLTNRSYRLRAGKSDLVLRLPGAGTERFIARAVEMKNTAAAARAGVTPPVIHGDPDSGVLVTAFVDEGATLSADDLRSPAVLVDAAFLLRGLHESEALFEGAFDPLAAIDRYLALAPHSRLAELRLRVEATRDQLAAGDRRPCHGDPVVANFLASPRGFMLIDWEYSGMADPAWDLAVLALDAEFAPTHEALLLSAYGRPDLRDRLTLMKPLVRLVSAAWANVQLAAGSMAAGLSEMIAAALADRGD